MRIGVNLVVSILFLSLANPAAFARVRVDGEAMPEIESIALVGYSFFRNVEMEPASPFKLQRKVIELTPEDPEYQMMLVAHEKVIEVLGNSNSFEMLDQEVVFADTTYQSLSKDPGERVVLSWYFPADFRDLKKNEENATALATALDVDAVLWIQFGHRGSSSSSTTLGVLGKKKEYVKLRGELTLYDRQGDKLISGAVTSDRFLKSATRSLGAVGEDASGIEIETDNNVTADDDLWFPMLENYLAKLESDLNR